MTALRRHESMALRLLEAALALALLVIFLAWRDLPLVDLPQHAVQIASWMRLDAGQHGPRDLELNFRTPYLLAYPLLRALAPMVGVVIALKLVFWASIALQARTLRYLCERLGHDPWLGLLGFPLGLGYSFCFGFVSFCAALPLVYLLFGFAAWHREEPSWRSGVSLGLTLSLLLVAHGVAWGFSLALLGPILLIGGGAWWQRTWPMLLPLLLGAVWLAPGASSTRLGGDLWQWEPQRLLELPAQLVGIGSADWAATALGLVLLACVASSLAGLRAPLLAAPLVLACAGYMLFPTMFRGAGPLGPRFASFIVPALLLAFAPRFNQRLQLARRATVVALAWACALLFGWRLVAFNREMADFHELIVRIAPGLEVRPLVFERVGAAFPGLPAHLHVPAYYALEKGGSAGYSFAMYSISVIRFRPGAKIKMWGGAEWAPQSFDAQREADDYDYFLVRSSADLTRSLFGTTRPAAVLDRRVGSWWGYRRTLPR